MRALPAGVERFRIEGGQTLTVDIEPGDRIIVTDVEGGQPCELIVFGEDGRVDPGIIGAREERTSAALARARRAGPAALRERLPPRRIFPAAAGPPLRQYLPARRQPGIPRRARGILVVSAPGDDMQPGAQDTATPIRAQHRARKPAQRKDRIVLPDPLADPLQDIRVNSSTAEAYLVSAGEYIQIIDVAGRQCSDFQCFSARKLDKGRERPLDATTTRSLTGLGYPAPGLPAKFFDHDMEPLVEIVRDTVGRHDAFALACYAKFYEDMGYPGHVNCTDNFNRALEPYGIGPGKRLDGAQSFLQHRHRRQ